MWVFEQSCLLLCIIALMQALPLILFKGRTLLLGEWTPHTLILLIQLEVCA